MPKGELEFLSPTNSLFQKNWCLKNKHIQWVLIICWGSISGAPHRQGKLWKPKSEVPHPLNPNGGILKPIEDVCFCLWPLQTSE